MRKFSIEIDIFDGFFLRIDSQRINSGSPCLTDTHTHTYIGFFFFFIQLLEHYNTIEKAYRLQLTDITLYNRQLGICTTEIAVVSFSSTSTSSFSIDVFVQRSCFEGGKSMS